MNNSDVLIQIRDRLLSDIGFYKEALQSVAYEIQQIQRESTIYGQHFYNAGEIPPSEKIKYLEDLKSALRQEIGVSIAVAKKIMDIERKRIIASNKSWEQFRNK